MEVGQAGQQWQWFHLSIGGQRCTKGPQHNDGQCIILGITASKFPAQSFFEAQAGHQNMVYQYNILDIRYIMY